MEIQIFDIERSRRVFPISLDKISGRERGEKLNSICPSVFFFPLNNPASQLEREKSPSHKSRNVTGFFFPSRPCSNKRRKGSQMQGGGETRKKKKFKTENPSRIGREKKMVALPQSIHHSSDRTLSMSSWTLKFDWRRLSKSSNKFRRITDMLSPCKLEISGEPPRESAGLAEWMVQVLKKGKVEPGN